MLVASIAASAQQEKPPVFPEWDAKPHMHAVPPEYMNEHAIKILESGKHDFMFDGSGVTEYSVYHRIIKVLDRTGIEQFSQVDVPYRQNFSRIDSIKARTILPDGTVRNMEYKMLWGNSRELFFVLDGLEKNAEIEIMVKYKALPSFFGSYQFQSTIPVLNTFFELNFPKEMSFNLKGYHGFPAGSEQLVHGHKQVKIYVPNIPALEKQPYSFYNLYLMRLEYGLDHFTTRGGYISGDKLGWDQLANRIYKDFYTTKRSDSADAGGLYGFIPMDHYNRSKADNNAISKFLTSIGINGGETEIQKIKMIEEGIKTNIVQYPELAGRHEGNLDTILFNKTASEKGIIRLFCACFKATGIKHELGVTSDRTEHLMDPKFINWAPLNDYVFYFPTFDKYMAPNEEFSRYPEIPATMINNKGVFCRTNPESEFNVGKEVTEAEAVVRTISAPNVAATHNHLDININLDKEFDPTVNLSYAYSGYSAEAHRKELALLPKEKRREMVEGMIGILDKPEHLISYSFENENFNSVYAHKPLLLKAAVKAPQLVGKAGARYIIRIGEAIGEQPELYKKDERILPVDLAYPSTNTRTITMNIPEGAKVLNAQSLKMHVEHTEKDNANVTAYFNSDYKLTDNKLVVTITEVFMQMHYPVSEFENFKKVVNAAADFDKIGILVEMGKPKPVKKAKVKTVAAAKPVKHA